MALSHESKIQAKVPERYRTGVTKEINGTVVYEESGMQYEVRGGSVATAAPKEKDKNGTDPELHYYTRHRE